MIQYGRGKYPEWKEAHSGMPYVVSSISVNNDHHLKVVANSGRIDDKEEFAREIVHMCQDNSFRSIRFSTDINYKWLSVRTGYYSVFEPQGCGKREACL